MSALKKLVAQAPAVEVTLDDGTPVVKLGLIVTLYFKEGYTQASKQQVVSCFERFYSEFDTQLKTYLHSGSKGYKKLSKDSFTKPREKVLKSEPNEIYEWQLSSAATVKDVDTHSLSFLNSPEIHGDKQQSYIKLILPWTWLTEPDGVERYRLWLTYLCNQVGAEHGYGGLSCILPYDFDSDMPIEYQLAQQYIGLEVDTMAYSYRRELLDNIKGVNWFTVLGERYVERLGGEEAIRHVLAASGDAIALTRYERGLIIQAGDYPELGEVEEGPPPAYVAVNRVVKPLRIPNPDQLHTYSPYGDCFEQEDTEHWYARFDEFASTPAGEPCPLSGYWQIPADPNSRCYVTKGNTMPRCDQISWEESLWMWVGKE